MVVVNAYVHRGRPRKSTPTVKALNNSEKRLGYAMKRRLAILVKNGNNAGPRIYFDDYGSILLCVQGEGSVCRVVCNCLIRFYEGKFEKFVKVRTKIFY